MSQFSSGHSFSTSHVLFVFSSSGICFKQIFVNLAYGQFGQQSLEIGFDSFWAMEYRGMFLCSNYLSSCFVLFCFHILFIFWPSLIWFLFNPLFQNIIKGNIFINYNVTFTLAFYRHTFQSQQGLNVALLSSGWKKSLPTCHMQQWHLKSTLERKNGTDFVIIFHL